MKVLTMAQRGIKSQQLRPIFHSRRIFLFPLVKPRTQGRARMSEVDDDDDQPYVERYSDPAHLHLGLFCLRLDLQLR